MFILCENRNQKGWCTAAEIQSRPHHFGVGHKWWYPNVGQAKLRWVVLFIVSHKNYFSFLLSDCAIIFWFFQIRHLLVDILVIYLMGSRLKYCKSHTDQIQTLQSCASNDQPLFPFRWERRWYSVGVITSNHLMILVNDKQRTLHSFNVWRIYWTFEIFQVFVFFKINYSRTIFGKTFLQIFQIFFSISCKNWENLEKCLPQNSPWYFNTTVTKKKTVKIHTNS